MIQIYADGVLAYDSRLEDYALLGLTVTAGLNKGVNIMKADIHPKYHEVTVTCACGATFKTGTTKDCEVLKVDICSNCHPFFTGKQKLVDTGGRVDKFKKRYGL